MVTDVFAIMSIILLNYSVQSALILVKTGKQCQISNVSRAWTFVLLYMGKNRHLLYCLRNHHFNLPYSSETSQIRVIYY